MKASLVGEETVKPGAETKVEIRIATASWSGRISKSATVETDDPANPKLQLTLSATVVVNLDFENLQLRFQDAQVGERRVERVRFVAEKPDAVKFGKVTCTGPGIQARMVQETEQGQTVWYLEVELRPSMAGHVGGTVEVELLEPEPKTLKIYATASVIGDVRVTPQVMVLHETGEGAETNVRLEAVKDPFTIKSAKDPAGLLSVEIEALAKGRTYVLHVRLTKAGKAKGTFESAIVIKTSSAKQPEIKVPVHVLPQGSQPALAKPKAMEALVPVVK